MAAAKKEIEKVRPVAHLELTENDQQLADELGLDLSRNAKQLIASVIDKTNRSVTLIVETGLELIALKGKCEHGEFIPLLESFGLSKERAAEFMRYARFTSSLPASQRPKVLELPKKKVLALASANPETVNDILDNEEEFEDIKSLNPTQMRNRIKQLEVNLENAELTNKKLRKEALEKNTTGIYHEEVEAVRMESVTITSEVFLLMDDLTAIIDRVASAGFMGKDYTDKDQTVASTTFYTNVHAIHARTSKLMHDCMEWLGEDITKGVKNIPILSDKECVQALQNRELLVAEHEARNLARKKQRADARKKASRSKAAK